MNPHQMENQKTATERAIVYIDGFNLYFGLRASTVSKKGQHRLPKKSYWLDLQQLSEKIVKNNSLVAVKYFTARIKGNPAKQYRQNAFISAVQLHCPKLQIFEGRYLLRQMLCGKCRRISSNIICPFCGNVNNFPEEKKSDVNIATQMLKDAYENNFDIAYLISGDSDIVPPIQVIRAMSPPKKVAVAFPPCRGGTKELEAAADFCFYISSSNIKNSILPDVIRKPDGTELRIPPRWDHH